MQIPTSFRPLFRGCFLFVFLIEFYKYSLLSKVSVPSFGDVFYSCGRRVRRLYGWPLVSVPSFGDVFYSKPYGVSVAKSPRSFRPLFRGCFLFQMPNYCDFTVYMLGKFPSPLSGMFFIFPSLKMSILSGYILIFAAESFHTELLISPDRHYSRFDTTSSGIGADLYFLFSIDNISSAAFRKLCSRFSHIDPTHNNSIFYRLSIIFSFN